MKIYLPFGQVFMSRIVRWHPGGPAIMTSMGESAVPPSRIWVSMDLNHQISQTRQTSRTDTRLHGMNQHVVPVTVTICK